MKKLMILFACVSISLLVTAQEEHKLIQSKVQISGTSTLHDWTADVSKSDGYATLKFEKGALTSIQNLTITMDTRSIKSEKGAMMDKNMHKALKTEKYSTITFKVDKITPVAGSSIKADGKLTIAGVTQSISINATGKRVNSDWVFSGSKQLKMTDYNVEPPVLLLGSLKTDNAITISFEATFSAMAGLSQN